MSDELPDGLDDGHELAMALRLLSGGVPLTLLLDLAGPLRSRDIYREEVADTGWLVGVA